MRKNSKRPELTSQAVILVPGAWHHAHQYGDLTQRLESAGYKVVGIDIPSAVPRDQHPTKGYTDDVEAIQSAIKSEVDQGQKVAVLAHSYGGIPGVSRGHAGSNRSRSIQPWR